MKRLYTCKACGFLSTHAPAFVRVEGVLFDKECAGHLKAGREPVATWAREKIEARKAEIAKDPRP